MTHTLTPRQIQVLQSLADTGSWKITEQKLGISHTTLFYYLRGAGDILGTSGAMQTVVAAMRKGLVT